MNNDAGWRSQLKYELRDFSLKWHRKNIFLRNT